MSFEAGAFEYGVEGAFGLVKDAYVEAGKAREKYRELMLDPKTTEEELAAAAKAVETPPVLWQRIVGFDPTVAWFYEPSERRAGLARLVRAVERMYRAELRNKGGARSPAANSTGVENGPVADALGAVSRIGEFVEGPASVSEVMERENRTFEDGTRSFAGRSALFDPLPEICAYLGIAQRKLSELCRQQTGLRIHEIGDCIRVEGLREHLKERFRGLVHEWKDGLSEKDEDKLRGRMRESAWRFLHWVRGRGKGETRKKLAWELGVPTPARLGRAAFVCFGMTLEEVELQMAKAVMAELERYPGMRNEEHGACLSDVPPVVGKTPFEEEEEEKGREGEDGEG